MLNGSGYVSPETREKIENAMRELNYIPNELTRGMFRQRSGIIAMLVPHIRHPFFSSLAHCIEQELFQVGYKLMLCSTGDNVKRECEYMQTLKSNIVDGVIIAVNNLDHLEYENYNKPLIMLDYQVNDKIPVVVSNHTQGGKLAAEEFIRSNCKNIIHISDGVEKEQLSHIISFNCHRALDDELSRNGIESRNVPIRRNAFDFDGYLNMARTILENYPTIDGVMAADMAAATFLKAAVQIGKKVPEDFCVVAYNSVEC